MGATGEASLDQRSGLLYAGRTVTPKQRVHAALSRQPTDRVPVFMWFHPQTARRLGEVLEVPASAVGAAMGDDVRMTWVNNNWAMEGVVHEHDGESHVDPWGVRWVKEGAFNQPVGFPLADKSREEMLAYEFPDDKIDFLMHLMDPVLAQGEKYFIGCDVSPCVFEMYWRLRGLENAILDIAMDPELTAAMFAKCARFALRLSQRACAELPIDWLWCGDDVAGQDSMVMSPTAWRELIKPLMADIFAVGKVSGPVGCPSLLRRASSHHPRPGGDRAGRSEPGAGRLPGMDPLELKREFGGSLSFMGGVDTQKLLPFGSGVRGTPGNGEADPRDDRGRGRLHSRRLAHHSSGDTGREHLRPLRDCRDRAR